MRLLDHHPRFPAGSESRNVTVAALPEDLVAATAHIIASQLVFVVLDGDLFRVGYADNQRTATICHEPAATPNLSTAAAGFAYIDHSGTPRVVDILTGSESVIPTGGTEAVVLSNNMAWAAVRSSGRTSIWCLASARLVRETDEFVLTLTNRGEPHLVLSAAAAALTTSLPTEGKFTLRGAVAREDCSFSYFDSIHGTASVTRKPGDSSLIVDWIPGRWVVGIVQENDRSCLSLQRLNELERYPISADDSIAAAVPPHVSKFTVEWISAVDGQRIPLSRFHTSDGSNEGSLVTVHGGFGISLRPMSGLPVGTAFRNIVYAHVRGGGELGKMWAAAGRGTRKSNALDDLGAVVREEGTLHRVSLLGASHGGWLALLTAMREPDLVDRVCVTSPITHLRAYLTSALGQKHRDEFPDEEDLDTFDPIRAIAHVDGTLPHLMVVHGAADSIAVGQDPEEFAELWHRAGGFCQVVRHNGGHYAPPAGEIDLIKRAQTSFLGLSTLRRDRYRA